MGGGRREMEEGKEDQEEEEGGRGKHSGLELPVLKTLLSLSPQLKHLRDQVIPSSTDIKEKYSNLIK